MRCIHHQKLFALYFQPHVDARQRKNYQSKQNAEKLAFPFVSLCSVDEVIIGVYLYAVILFDDEIVFVSVFGIRIFRRFRIVIQNALSRKKLYAFGGRRQTGATTRDYLIIP